MDLTIIRNEAGEIVGAAKGHLAVGPPEHVKEGGPDQFGLVAGPGQTLEHVHVPGLSHGDFEDAEEFHRKLHHHLKGAE